MDIPDYEGVFLLIRNTTLDTNIHNLSKTKIMVIDEICISRKYGSLGGVRNGVSISNGVFSFTTFFCSGIKSFTVFLWGEVCFYWEGFALYVHCYMFRAKKGLHW
jgi:hypothetical protein